MRSCAQGLIIVELLLPTERFFFVENNPPLTPDTHRKKLRSVATVGHCRQNGRKSGSHICSDKK